MRPRPLTKKEMRRPGGSTCSAALGLAAPGLGEYLGAVSTGRAPNGSPSSHVAHDVIRRISCSLSPQKTQDPRLHPALKQAPPFPSHLDAHPTGLSLTSCILTLICARRTPPRFDPSSNHLSVSPCPLPPLVSSQLPIRRSTTPPPPPL